MSKSTLQQLTKIESVPSLYKHEGNGHFYVYKKHKGKRYIQVLKDEDGKAVKTQQAAKLALHTWIASLTGKQQATLENLLLSKANFTVPMVRDMLNPEPVAGEFRDGIMQQNFDMTWDEAKAKGIDLSPLMMSQEEIQQVKDDAKRKETLTLSEAFDLFVKYKGGNKEGTKKIYLAHKRAFELHGGKDLLAMPVGMIKPSDLAEFLNKLVAGVSTQYFNNISITLNQLFEMLRVDGVIAVNLLSMLPKNVRRKKQKHVRDTVPTIEQCEAIVQSILKQKESASRKASSDLCAFVHLAATGEAEATSLTWEDVDFENEVINVRRKKTDKPFEIPFYPHLKPWLVAYAESKPDRKPTDKLFKMKSIKQALYNACKRLKYPAWSPRDLRKARITWLLRKGIPVETLADWQGHQDNGVLIRRTYANVIDDSKKNYQKEQLKKIS